MRVLAAPDKFKGTLTASEAAESISQGWKRGRPKDQVDELPMADGGEGTLDALVAALGGRLVSERVTGPLGEPIPAAYGLVDTEGLAIVEMSRASGLSLVPKGRLDPLRATTRGTGELIRSAVENDVGRLVVCIGGSATTDGGAGMAQALGVRLLDERDRDLEPGGAALLELARVDVDELDPRLRDVDVVVASDVDNPLTGPQGAAAVYGPQKGASPQDVELLDRALARYAEVVKRDLGVDVVTIRGSGAAGGLGAGLIAFLEATLRSGVDVVMEATRFRERLEDAGLVITGEGRLDESSLHGKVPDGVLRAAQQSGTPAILVCGDASIELDGVTVASLVGRFGRERALTDAASALQELADALSRAWGS